MLTLVLLTVVVAGAAMLAMATGTILSGRCLRGSCGGDPLDPDGQSPSCDHCPLRPQSPFSPRRSCEP